MDADRHNRPLSTLLVDLQRATLRLIRQEIALAKAEVGERIGSWWGSAMAALVVLFVAPDRADGPRELVGEFMPEVLALWLGYLIVGGVTLLVGLFLGKLAIDNLRDASQLMARTGSSIGRDFEALERETR